MSAAFFASFVVFNNLMAGVSNYILLSHVLKMDTLFPNSSCLWRAVDSSSIYHVVFWFIIIVEAIIAFLCLLGSYRLFKLRNDAMNFNKAKGIAILGLTFGIILWFTGFMIIGGEWFLMWQSTKWNGLQGSFRIVVIFGIILIYLNQTDSGSEA
ncbi:MAG: DUF2165 domain-containing protein [Psychromonas sp.]|nr:DUF2165 domain-containing protein [Psychromonas sp.]